MRLLEFDSRFCGQTPLLLDSGVFLASALRWLFIFYFQHCSHSVSFCGDDIFGDVSSDAY